VPAYLNSDEFRATLGLFATGVTVVTARADALVHGMTANAFASLSLDPLLALVCVERDAVMRKVLHEAGCFAVSVLAADGEPLARWFSDSGRPSGMAQFDPFTWSPGRTTGAPLLAGSLAWLECDVHAVHDGGDHEIFVGRVRSLGRSGEGEPLLYFRGEYVRFDGYGGGSPGAGSGPVRPRAQVPNSRSPKSPSPGTM
jgi:flavin reductase (DIM6/NTAB) family NADH-FMN oxidoreductase RutF